jgi:hypothetical protein
MHRKDANAKHARTLIKTSLTMSSRKLLPSIVLPESKTELTTLRLDNADFVEDFVI